MKILTNTTVLALFPNHLGVGYALFDSPKNLIDYGIGYIQPVNSKKSLERVKKYVAFYKPDVVIVREIAEQRVKKNKRTFKLIKKICDQARSENLQVITYTRTQIKEVFEQFEASSKYHISKKIIAWFPHLEGLQFPKRKRWMNENHNTGVFDAIALGITHFYLR